MSWNGAIPHKDRNRVKGLRNKRKQKSAKALMAKQMQQAIRESTLVSVYEASEYDRNSRGRDNERSRGRRKSSDNEG
jgi:hypothetical protein